MKVAAATVVKLCRTNFNDSMARENFVRPVPYEMNSHQTPVAKSLQNTQTVFTSFGLWPLALLSLWMLGLNILVFPVLSLSSSAWL